MLAQHSLVMIFIQARNPATTYKQGHSLVMIFIQARNPATIHKQGHSLVMICITAKTNHHTRVLTYNSSITMQNALPSHGRLNVIKGLIASKIYNPHDKNIEFQLLWEPGTANIRILRTDFDTIDLRVDRDISSIEVE
jgi:hypothetical protein